MLCVVMKGLKVSNFALLLVVFKWHHGSEGVKGAETESKARLDNEIRKEAGLKMTAIPTHGMGLGMT